MKNSRKFRNLRNASRNWIPEMQGPPMTQSKTLVVLATRNTGKIKEFAQGMGTERYDFKVLPDVGFTENILENGRSFAENAGIKGKAVSESIINRFRKYRL